jgi:hypothetical protein
MQYQKPFAQKLNEFQQIAQVRLANVLEIYYEKNVHKKFLADVYAVIPKGRKCVLWFTHKQCWMFQIAKRPYHSQPNQPNQHSQLETVSFDDIRMVNAMPCMDDAWYSGDGTILYGTCVSEKSNIKKRFSVENVHYFCGIKQQNDGSMNQFIEFFDAYNKQKCRANAPLQFFMPIMHTSFNDALKDAMQVTSYDVYCIQHRFLQRACTEYKNILIDLAGQPQPTQNQQPHSMQSQPIPTPSFFPRQVVALAHNHPIKPPTRTFVLKPDAQNDIYYVLNGESETITHLTMIAHIPNYKISVMMNSIFRNIKENRNLDALEESDDEDELDPDKSKFVDLNKCVRMTCMFNHKFKRWQPCACA